MGAALVRRGHQPGAVRATHLAGDGGHRRAGRAGDYQDRAPEYRTFAEARTDYRDSWRRLAEVAARPIPDGRLAEHEFFGPLDAREWVALITYQHELHVRKMDQIRQTEEYRRAQGAGW